MSGQYLTSLADWLRSRGLDVREVSGWRSRARSSGGYSSGRPWIVMLHHTASYTSSQNDVDYMCYGSNDRPLANIYIGRAGDVWVMAAGATNTNGKGRAVPTSKGTVSKDQMNLYAVGIELGNNGVGEQYPQAQIDAMFTATICLLDHLGLADHDVGLHQWYAPDRKIDPATCNVAGPWRPDAWNSSGTWDINDVWAEITRRRGSKPGPTPTPPSGDDVEKYLVRTTDGMPWVTDFASYATQITEQQAADGVAYRGYIKGGDNEPFPLSPSDSDLMLRLNKP